MEGCYKNGTKTMIVNNFYIRRTKSKVDFVFFEVILQQIYKITNYISNHNQLSI